MLSVILLLRVWLKKHTSFKNPENFHYINFMLTSSPNIFQNSCAIEFGLSDIRKVTATILKTKFENWSLEYNTIGTIKLKLCPMINLNSICYLNCQWKTLVLLSRVSRTGFFGGETFWPKSPKTEQKLQKHCFFTDLAPITLHCL